MTDERTDEQKQVDEAIEEVADNIMDAVLVLTGLQYYSDVEYVMVRRYMRRRLEEFAYDVEHQRGVRTLDPEKEACQDVDADEVLKHLQDDLQTAD